MTTTTELTTEQMIEAVRAKWENVTEASEAGNLIKELEMTSDKIEAAFNKIIRVSRSDNSQAFMSRFEQINARQDSQESNIGGAAKALTGLSVAVGILKANQNILDKNQQKISTFNSNAEKAAGNYAYNLDSSNSETLQEAFPQANSTTLCAIPNGAEVFVYPFDPDLNDGAGAIVDCICPSKDYKTFYFKNTENPGSPLEGMGCILRTVDAQNHYDPESKYSFYVDQIDFEPFAYYNTSALVFNGQNSGE